MWHIPRELPHPKDRLGLIAIDSRTAKFYIANEDVIEEISELNYTEPEKHGRQGFFMARASGIVMRSGTLDDYRSEKERRRFFFHQVADDLLKRRTRGEFDGLVIFVAKEYKKLFDEALNPAVRQTIVKQVVGDFVHTHPCDLLKKIKTGQAAGGAYKKK
ncbi:MAG: hypothetical protein HW383_293 [Candidatus Magasanikbacteria bacterium]|nr:hypothetical protein [Candidatus Magasanikbacteria bacterium]